MQSSSLRDLGRFFPGWKLVEGHDACRFLLVEADPRTTVILFAFRLRWDLRGGERRGLGGWPRSRLKLSEVGVECASCPVEGDIDLRERSVELLAELALCVLAQDEHLRPANEAAIKMSTPRAFDARIVQTCRDRHAFDALAAAFARHLRAGDVIALTGALGAGKTRFVDAVVTTLHGIQEASSPTFTLRHRYERAGFMPIEHLDGYRLEDPAELPESGLEEAFTGDALVLVEWPEHLASLLPQRHYRVLIEGAGEEPRRVSIEPPS